MSGLFSSPILRVSRYEFYTFMHRVAWLTDLHLDFVDAPAWEKLIADLNEQRPDSVLIGGDIAEATNVVAWLSRFEQCVECPTFLVLGNHDFYHGGIQSVRDQVDDFCGSSERMNFLTTMSSPVSLTERVGLVGHDGWADGREGDYNRSLIMMNDYRLIDELARFSKHDRLAELHRLGDEAASHIRSQLVLALSEFDQVFVLTHVPPFRDACWYQGSISDDEWAPHFVCQAMGRAILDVAAIYPGNEITVLCGHTHSGGTCQPAANVRVITGEAVYGSPGVTRMFDFK